MGQTLGKHLHEVMGWPGPMTCRQFQVWQAWTELEWNHPDRHDNYQMQTACEIRRLFAKDPNRWQPKDLVLEFKVEKDLSKKGTKGIPKSSSPLSLREQEIAASKALWLGRMTMPVTVVKVITEN